MEFYFGFTVVVAAVWVFIYRAFYFILSVSLRTRTVLSLCRVLQKERKKYTLMLGCWGLCKHVIDHVWCKGKQLRSPCLTWLALIIGVGRCIVSAPTHIKVLLYCIVLCCIAFEHRVSIKNGFNAISGEQETTEIQTEIQTERQTETKLQTVTK